MNLIDRFSHRPSTYKVWSIQRIAFALKITLIDYFIDVSAQGLASAAYLRNNFRSWSNFNAQWGKTAAFLMTQNITQILWLSRKIYMRRH